MITAFPNHSQIRGWPECTFFAVKPMSPYLAGAGTETNERLFCYRMFSDMIDHPTPALRPRLHACVAMHDLLQQQQHPAAPASLLSPVLRSVRAVLQSNILKPLPNHSPPLLCSSAHWPRSVRHVCSSDSREDEAEGSEGSNGEGRRL
jgi:hypothetical protein